MEQVKKIIYDYNLDVSNKLVNNLDIIKKIKLLTYVDEKEKDIIRELYNYNQENSHTKSIILDTIGYIIGGRILFYTWDLNERKQEI